VLLRTYTCDAGSSPTSTTARPGTTPRARSLPASAATSARTTAATCFPSRMRAAMGLLLFLRGRLAGRAGVRRARGARGDGTRRGVAVLVPAAALQVEGGGRDQ